MLHQLVGFVETGFSFSVLLYVKQEVQRRHENLNSPTRGIPGYGFRYIFILGDNSADHGKDNPRLGGVHDFSASSTATLYSKPRIAGRYVTVESLRDKTTAFNEIEVYSESMRKYI